MIGSQAWNIFSNDVCPFWCEAANEQGHCFPPEITRVTVVSAALVLYTSDDFERDEFDLEVQLGDVNH